MKKTKAIIAILIVLFMILPFIPFKVFATDKVTVQLNNVVNHESDSANSTTLTCGTNKVAVVFANGAWELKQNANGWYFEVDAGTDLTFTPNSTNAQLVIGGTVQVPGAGNAYSVNNVQQMTIIDFNFLVPTTEISLDSATVAGNVITFNVNGTNVTATVSGPANSFEFNENKLNIKNANINDVQFTFDNNLSENMSVYVMDNGTRKEVHVGADKKASLNGLNLTDNRPHFGIERLGGGQQGGNQQGNQQGNNQGNQQNNNQEPAGGPNNIEFDVEFTDTQMNLWINDMEVMSDADGELKSKFNGTVNGAGYDGTEAGKTNKLKFQASFGSYPVKEYVINGVTYKEGDANVRVDEYGTIITVPADAKYTIRGVGDTNAAVPRTIIWTNPQYQPKDAADAEWIKEFSLSHGSAYIKAVYDKNGNLVDPQEYLTTNWDKSELDRGVGKDGFGWVTIKPGSKVVFEFVPEYGYQLTNVKSNGQSLGVGEKTNQFVFDMPDTNIHFDAEFTKTDDIVKANSEKISSGKVSLGSNKLDGGTAQLTVNDVEVSEEKVEGFEQAAGEYEISDYLNIDLYQVFYKGKKDANDVWSNKIEELDNEVRITLKLKDGINAEDIVIIHNIHDGSKYEVIEIESYDKETNTITFKAKSFSNYAIATKGESAEETTEEKETSEEAKEKNETSNPATGDNIAIYIALFAVAVLGVLVTFKFTKKNKENKK